MLNTTSYVISNGNLLTRLVHENHCALDTYLFNLVDIMQAHWGKVKMATIMQTTFLNTFSLLELSTLIKPVQKFILKDKDDNLSLIA